MKHWTLRILLCLFLGVVTTVGVAWGIAFSLDTDVYLLSDRTDGWSRVDKKENSRLTITIFCRQSTGKMQATAFVGSFLNPSSIEKYDSIKSVLDLVPPWCRQPVLDSPALEESSQTQFDVILFEASGWPSLALWCQPTHGDVLGKYKAAEGGIAPTPQSSLWGKIGTIPLRPIFPGFIINTLFYGMIWFGVFFGISATRRTIRRKRGHCINCGYDLRGNFDSGCSECGWGRES